MTIIAAADGSALGNPGPAGWAWYVDDDRWAAGGWAHGTNNMGELTAVLDLLQQTAHLPDELHIFCDSTYVINSVTKWMKGWKRNGWKKKDGKPVLNVDIMRAIDEAMPGKTGRKVTFEWVKGHAGHELNEAADRLANAAAASWRDGVPPAPGPGFADAAERAHPAAFPGQHDPEPDLFTELSELSKLTGTASATVVGATSDEEEVVALERSLLADSVRSDRASVAALLHPDWREIGRSGRLWTREEMLAEIGPIPPVELEVVETVRIAPDQVLLIWRAHAAAGITLRSSLWSRQGGGWRQVFHQGTPES